MSQVRSVKMRHKIRGQRRIPREPATISKNPATGQKNAMSSVLRAEWRRACAALTRDSVRVRVPRAFLSTLTLFFHHVSDAMAGDDRPDHGLAKMREGRAYYRDPFYALYGTLRRAELRMRPSQARRALRLLQRYRDLSEQRWDRAGVFRGRAVRSTRSVNVPSA